MQKKSLNVCTKISIHKFLSSSDRIKSFSVMTSEVAKKESDTIPPSQVSTFS